MTNGPDKLANEPWTQISEGMLTRLLAPKLIHQLMAEIKADVREMQARGNYGDGQVPASQSSGRADRKDFGQMETSSRMGRGWEAKVCVSPFILCQMTR